MLINLLVIVEDRITWLCITPDDFDSVKYLYPVLFRVNIANGFGSEI